MGLPDYLDRAVIGTSARIINTGDGLSKAMNIEPEVFQPGEEGVVVLRGTWTKHEHVYDTETGCYQLKQTLKASTIVILKPEAVPGVEHHLDEMDAKIATKADLAEGVHKLPTPEALHDEHAAGGHAMAVVPACPDCREELDAAEAEASGNVSPIGKPKATPKAAKQA